MAGEGRVSIEEGVVFGTGGGRDLRCDIYTPPNLEEPAPAVLLVHGGGWRSGDRSQLRGYGILLGRQGYVCVASEYRLVPESPWPAQIHDVKAALRFMRAEADRLAIDPQRIAIEGNSAGAHLALLAAGTPNRAELEGTGGHEGVGTEVAAAIGVYTPTLFHHGGAAADGAIPLAALSSEASAEVAAAASPVTHVSADYPPTMLIHGGADTLVPPAASIVMYSALVAAGVPAELHMYADQPHAFDREPAYGRQCAAEMLLFLERYVRARVAA
ncbi:MAG TPA: alpha/beta hydrolase [Acidimicrobiales bacterium]|nr:alpha/beta hydrolase [Acidimicrobiales bacterium]